TQLLHLTFYSAADITPILAVALGSHASDISPALATAVHTVTGGSLLWIQEVVLLLLGTSQRQASRDSPDSEAGSDLGELGNLNVPQLESLILCRFDALPAMESQILRTASHIGYRFMAETLIGVLSPNLKGHLFDALDSLVKQRWLLFDSAESGVYCFAHKHARQVVYYVIPQSERDKLHRAIAAYTERVGADDPAQFLDIAQHFSHFDGVKTFEYTVRAAHHMMWQTPPLLKAALGTLGTALSYASWKMEIELLPALLKAVLALAGQ
ncbi:hypothetical protein B484DRAFT_410729, partial [Ochromonadaceae sp. CCMP2298]